MAAELLGLLSLTQLQKLDESQQNQNQNQQQQHHHHQYYHNLLPNNNLNLMSGSWMWNPKAQVPPEEDDDSWEVRAFAEDTGNVMGTTWPPRSYTCTFCRREFRSAQALGGHMNVHRRDRARLHQTQPAALINPTSSLSSTTTSSPTQEFVPNGTLRLLYQLPTPTTGPGVFTSAPTNACSSDSPSTLLSISSYHPSNNVMATAAAPPPSINFPIASPELISTTAEPLNISSANNNLNVDKNNNISSSNLKSNEELDLELRLWHRPKNNTLTDKTT